MRLLIAAGLALLLLGGATPVADGLLTWPDLFRRARPAPDASFRYGPDLFQRVNWWRPAGKGPFPTVVMVHGGCWTSSVADLGIMAWIADDLRRHGVAVWNIDYRGVDRPGGGYPGTFLDAAAATDLLREKGPALGADLSQVVAVGHSAGGHLALWLAARPKLPHASPLWTAHPLGIAHAISLGGLPDLEATRAASDNGCGTEVVGQLVGDHFADTSLPRLFPLGVPQDLVNGREDRIIPFHLGAEYVTRARAAGDLAMLHPIPATGHVELIAPETPAWAEARRLILAALRR